MSTAATLEPTMSCPADYSDRVIDTFLSFLREVFKNIPDYRFNEDERLTQIMIHDKFARNLDTVGHKPALVTDLKNIVKGDIVLDDIHGLQPGFGTGVEQRTDLFRTTLIIHSISAVQAECRRLAYLVGVSIYGLERELFQQGIFDLSVPTVVAEPRKLITSSQGELWTSSTTVQISFQDFWVTKVINSEKVESFGIVINSPTFPNNDC